MEVNLKKDHKKTFIFKFDSFMKIKKKNLFESFFVCVMK